MAKLKKNEWFVALDKNGNIVNNPENDLAIMGKTRTAVESELFENSTIDTEKNKIEFKKVEISITNFI